MGEKKPKIGADGKANIATIREKRESMNERIPNLWLKTQASLFDPYLSLLRCQSAFIMKLISKCEWSINFVKFFLSNVWWLEIRLCPIYQGKNLRKRLLLKYSLRSRHNLVVHHQLVKNSVCTNKKALSSNILCLYWAKQKDITQLPSNKYCRFFHKYSYASQFPRQVWCDGILQICFCGLFVALWCAWSLSMSSWHTMTWWYEWRAKPTKWTHIFLTVILIDGLMGKHGKIQYTSIIVTYLWRRTWILHICYVLTSISTYSHIVFIHNPLALVFPSRK